MGTLDIIAKKRNGEALTAIEIRELIHNYTNEIIPEYQMAAWLMAVYFQGMSDNETAELTLAMAESGDMVDLSSIPGIKVDKHSTGGVADTTTLILAPLVAAAGVPVAKMSGRGLGFTGGTIDKLDSISGFRTTLERDEFINTVKKHGLAVIAQSSSIAPADGKIYALRDVTATVESIPLIASSIMSKKIAAGADKILLDVKVGSGAFMKNIEQAVQLAQVMVRIGNIVNRKTIAVLTNMDEPLGNAVGNSLEVEEAIAVLKGKQAGPLKEVSVSLGAYMLSLAGVEHDIEKGRRLLCRLIEQGDAIAKFTEFVTAQGGNPLIVSRTELLPQASTIVAVESDRNGYIQNIATAEIGRCAAMSGAGRQHKLQEIDLSAGLVLQCRVGEYVEKGQPLAIIHTNSGRHLAELSIKVRTAFTISQELKKESIPLIIGIVDDTGFHNLQ